MSLNLTKHDGSRVDVEGTWYKDQLFLTFVRTDADLGTTKFHLTLDDIDLEHFIATLMNFEHERT